MPAADNEKKATSINNLTDYSEKLSIGTKHNEYVVHVLTQIGAIKPNQTYSTTEYAQLNELFKNEFINKLNVFEKKEKHSIETKRYRNMFRKLEDFKAGNTNSYLLLTKAREHLTNFQALTSKTRPSQEATALIQHLAKLEAATFKMSAELINFPGLNIRLAYLTPKDLDQASKDLFSRMYYCSTAEDLANVTDVKLLKEYIARHEFFQEKRQEALKNSAVHIMPNWYTVITARKNTILSPLEEHLLKQKKTEEKIFGKQVNYDSQTTAELQTSLMNIEAQAASIFKNSEMIADLKSQFWLKDNKALLLTHDNSIQHENAIFMHNPEDVFKIKDQRLIIEKILKIKYALLKLNPDSAVAESPEMKFIQESCNKFLLPKKYVYEQTIKKVSTNNPNPFGLVKQNLPKFIKKFLGMRTTEDIQKEIVAKAKDLKNRPDLEPKQYDIRFIGVQDVPEYIVNGIKDIALTFDDIKSLKNERHLLQVLEKLNNLPPPPLPTRKSELAAKHYEEKEINNFFGLFTIPLRSRSSSDSVSTQSNNNKPS